jgi:hypothetical protein
MGATLIRVTSFACIFCVATVAHAEGQGWTGVWKIKSGPCPEGAVVTLTERPGVLTIQGKSGNDPYTREVRLAADGSGTLEFISPYFGAIKMTVAAGQGKRAISQGQQSRGNCEWTLSQ